MTRRCLPTLYCLLALLMLLPLPPASATAAPPSLIPLPAQLVWGDGSFRVDAATAVVVQHADTLPELLTHADVTVQGVDGMACLLAEIVQRLSDQHQQR